MLGNMKRLTFLWGALLFMVTMIMLYMMLDTLSMAPGANRMDSEMMTMLESKLSKMEKDMNDNRLVVEQIKAEMVGLGANVNLGGIAQPPPQKAADAGLVKFNAAGDIDQGVVRRGGDIEHHIEETYSVVSYGKKQKNSDEMCKWVSEAKSTADINMHSVVNTLKFDNPDGGAWKQGWKVSYPEDKWTANNKLKIILVPHTHCDPGWVKTFETYYRTQTKKILDSFVPKLESNRKFKFMFSEMSYFSWWWSEIDAALKQRVKTLISNGQFEISTGGWVMTDEANAHYFAMLDQLIEGHQWLNSTLGYVPKSGWSIDPFGYSSTMAYLLKRSNFNSMLIQRVHYAVKKHLARSTNLEFMWRQHWDSTGSTEIYTHMMPFYSYDVPHTCGPEPAICCQFDFRRLPGSSYRCPWNIDPKAITKSNVADRTAMILDQWKKKATLYKTNVVLIPLGDDFRYMGPEEYDLQFDNYEKIFQYLDEHPELGARAQFGTLSDYFNAVYEDTKTTPGQSLELFPSLSGDFFSYADRDDHYWTGYFTSRPFQKNLDRVLEHNIRSAEIIFSLSQVLARQESLANFPSKAFAQRLENARRALGIFQHHDAITGTAKDFVVDDYGNRLLTALHASKRIIAECSYFLVHEKRKDYAFVEDKGNDGSEEAESDFSLDELREHHHSLPKKPVLRLKEGTSSAPVLVYNSLGQTRSEVVTFHSDWPWVKLIGPDGNAVHSQVEPVWREPQGPEFMPSDTEFAIKFVANLTGVSVAKYTVRKVEEGEDTYNHLSHVTLLNWSGAKGAAPEVKSIFPVESRSDDADFTLETNFLRAVFSGITGRLKSVQDLPTGVVHKADLEFIKYGTRPHKDKSGAYLFLPDGDARPLVTERPAMIRIIQGPLGSEAAIFTEFIQHTVRLHNSPGIDGASVELNNIVDIRNSRNLEVGMRVHTEVENPQQVFYSDLNGFQMQKRKYYQKLTLQGNVYPMPTQAYIQDGLRRVSVLASQSSGVANLVTGAIDVMFDRRLNQDDNRGLGQGVTDNKPTVSRYRLLFETRNIKVMDVEPETSFPSLQGQLSSLSLIHPMFVMPAKHKTVTSSLKTQVPLLKSDLPCEMHLLNLRTLLYAGELNHIPRESSLLLVRHLPSDCTFVATSLTCSTGNGQINPATLFNGMELKKSTVTSLTMTSSLADLKPGTAVQIPPMEILAVKVDLV